jgi:prepilin-type N-terminal cleavage/methylation domain-containing protein
MRNPRDFTARGFTLVELLIVLSLIGLLVAMLLPALNQARIVAQQTACAANLKGGSLAALTYAADNKTYLFPHYKVYQSQAGQTANQFYNRSWPNSFVGVWVPAQSLSDSKGALNTGHDLRTPAKNYVVNWRIWQCPSVATNCPTIDSALNSNTTLYGNYDYLPGSIFPFHNSGNPALTPAPIRMDDTGNASQRAMIGDVTRDLTPCGGLTYFVNHARAAYYTVPGGLVGNVSYNGFYFSNPALLLGSNVAFYDNHAQWLPPSQLVRTGQASDTLAGNGYMLGYMP